MMILELGRHLGCLVVSPSAELASQVTEEVRESMLEVNRTGLRGGV